MSRQKQFIPRIFAELLQPSVDIAMFVFKVKEIDKEYNKKSLS